MLNWLPWHWSRIIYLLVYLFSRLFLHLLTKSTTKKKDAEVWALIKNYSKYSHPSHKDSIPNPGKIFKTMKLNFSRKKRLYTFFFSFGWKKCSIFHLIFYLNSHIQKCEWKKHQVETNWVMTCHSRIDWRCWKWHTLIFFLIIRSTLNPFTSTVLLIWIRLRWKKLLVVSEFK